LESLAPLSAIFSDLARFTVIWKDAAGFVLPDFLICQRSVRSRARPPTRPRPPSAPKFFWVGLTWTWCVSPNRPQRLWIA